VRLEVVIGDAAERLSAELGRIAVNRAVVDRAECSPILKARLEARERELLHRQRLLQAALKQARAQFLKVNAS
jgi:hypothetical protein